MQILATQKISSNITLKKICFLIYFFILQTNEIKKKLFTLYKNKKNVAVAETNKHETK